MLEAKNLSKRYTDPAGACCRAISDVSFTLPEGKIVALVGESGCGKSTLSRILVGLERPDDGEVLLDGRPISRRGKDSRRRLCESVQLVWQDGKSAMDPRFTVEETIEEPMRYLQSVSRTQRRRRVEELLARVELSPEILRRRACELSGGQQKRVIIARALAASPRFILFDESISGLDVVLRKAMLDMLLRAQREEGSGYLFITHEIEAALYLADAVMVMRGGAIVEAREWTGDMNCFRHPYTRRLLQASGLLK